MGSTPAAISTAQINKTGPRIKRTTLSRRCFRPKYPSDTLGRIAPNKIASNPNPPQISHVRLEAPRAAKSSVEAPTPFGNKRGIKSRTATPTALVGSRLGAEELLRSSEAWVAVMWQLPVWGPHTCARLRSIRRPSRCSIRDKYLQEWCRHQGF